MRQHRHQVDISVETSEPRSAEWLPVAHRFAQPCRLQRYEMLDGLVEVYRDTKAGDDDHRDDGRARAHKKDSVSA